MNGNLRALLWWVAPALAFVALVGIETDWGGQLHRLPAAPQAIEPKPVVPALLPEYQVEGGVASLNETVDRTLFNPTRRPAPPATASAEGDKKVQSGQFVLTGTTLAGDRSIAFLKEVAGGKARTVRKGDKINGMLVADVLPDRVRFSRGDESEELMLKVSPGPKTTVAAAPPAGAGRAAGTLGSRSPAFGRSGRRPGRRRRRRPAAGRPAPDRPRHACRRQGGRRSSCDRRSRDHRVRRQCAAGRHYADRCLGSGLSTHATRQRAHQMTFRLRLERRRRPAADRGEVHSSATETGPRSTGAPGTTTMINRLSAPGTILAAIVLLAGCAATYRPDRGDGIREPAYGAAEKRRDASATRRQAPGTVAGGHRNDQGVQGHRRTGQGTAAGWRTARGSAGRGRERTVGDAQFRRRRAARSHPQHPDRHPRRVVHDRSGGRRHGDDTHDLGHSARGAAGDAGNDPSLERRDDDQGRHDLEGRARRDGRPRQHHAAARQQLASADAGLRRPDRAAQVRRRARR